MVHFPLCPNLYNAAQETLVIFRTIQFKHKKCFSEMTLSIIAQAGRQQDPPCFQIWRTVQKTDISNVIKWQLPLKRKHLMSFLLTNNILKWHFKLRKWLQFQALNWHSALGSCPFVSVNFNCTKHIHTCVHEEMLWIWQVADTCGEVVLCTLYGLLNYSANM